MLVVALALAIGPIRADAQTAVTPGTEVSVGYAFQNVDPLSHQFASTTEQGWDAAVGQRLTRHIAAVARLTGTYGASIATGLVVGPPALKGTTRPTTYTVMAGPRFSWPAHRFEPFVDGLVGFGWERAGMNGVDFVTVQTDTGLATRVDAGIDVVWTPRLAVRLIDVGWERLSVFQQTQRRLGVSASLVIGLGVTP